MTSEQKVTKSKRRWRPTRRGFLIGTGVVGAGVALGIVFGVPYGRLQLARLLDNASGPGGFDAEPWMWFEITPDNQIRLYVSKVEMGQGIHTALAQIGAEELGLDLSQLELRQATTHVGPTDGMGTAGSSSVSSIYDPLRQAAATLREMLRAEAATALGATPDQIVLGSASFALASDAGKSMTFGEIVAHHQARVGDEWETVEGATLKSIEEFTVIGKPAQRVDIPAKVTGGAGYGYDMRMDGMLYGAVWRTPTLEGKLTSATAGDAEGVDGVAQVVIQDGFAGVAASSREAARTAVSRLQVTWDEGKRWQQAELDALVTVGNGNGVLIQKEGDAPSLLGENTTLKAEYRTPMAAHASMEPQAALAHVTADKATIWVSTQSQGSIQGRIADVLGMERDQVEVIPTYLGGGFGRKVEADASLEAAILSKATGKPVHVGWDRAEEMRNGYFRPPTHSVLYARLDDSGRLVAIEHRQASSDVAFSMLPGFVANIMGADFGAWRGGTIHYGGIPNRQAMAWHVPLPVRTGWWRGLGLLANTFAIESFIDEVAQTAGQDPLAFRLAHLGNDDHGQRMAAVLERAAEMAEWGRSLPAGHGFGIACCTDVDTVVAQVAEVSLEGENVRVHNVWAAMDPGLVINPDGAAAQVEGSVMMALSSTLLEELTIVDGEVSVRNFDRYPLLTMKQAPHVEVALLEAPDRKPRGVGEPPMGPVAAAVANGLFAATGKRIRQMPFTAERIAAA